MGTSAQVTVQQDQISSGLQTYSMLDSNPPALRASWILWDSGFRGSGLQIGDQIIAVNGKPVTKPDALEELQRMLPLAIGQYMEYRFWANSGAQDGDAITLMVRRRKLYDVAWQTLEVRGQLRAQRRYLDDNQRWILGPGGPDRDGYDGFDGAWSYWYEEKIVPRCIRILDGGWQQQGFSSRYELQAHLEDKARVDDLIQRYPGPFADSVKKDWQAVLESLEGKAFTLTADDLKFRRAEDEKIQHAKEIADTAWEDFRKSIEAETIQPFPAIHPIRGDRAAVIGKYVVLPPIRNSDWLEQAGKTFFAFGSAADGWYFADAETSDAQAMLLALERYRRLVAPNIDESYAIVGRILPEPTLRVVAERGYYGLQIEIVAAMIGESMFVDVTQRKDNQATFAGEEIFDQPMHALPPDSATPREVMEAFFGALKTSDLKLWTSLFADWWVSYLPDGRALIYPHEVRISDQHWEDSRRTLLSKVYDVHVVWTGEPRELTTGKEFKGAPRIEEVDLEIEHVGLFDGEYRVFGDATVNRLWQLQRIDSGPWRISSIQPI